MPDQLRPETRRSIPQQTIRSPYTAPFEHCISPCPRVTVPPCPLASREYLADDMPMDIGQAVIAALESVGQSLVIKAQ